MRTMNLAHCYVSPAVAQAASALPASSYLRSRVELVASLPAGSQVAPEYAYAVRLLDGWQLRRSRMRQYALAWRGGSAGSAAALRIACLLRDTSLGL